MTSSLPSRLPRAWYDAPLPTFLSTSPDAILGALTRGSVDPVQWFLNDRSDVRSSWYLKDCATEFQVQGLELDWACVTWDGDFRAQAEGSGWSCHDFRGIGGSTSIARRTGAT